MPPRLLPAAIVALGGGCSFSPGTMPSVIADATGSATVDSAALDTSIDAPAPAPFALTGVRWLLPCTDNLGSNNCHCVVPQTQMVMVGGVASDRWTVTVRIRGIMEAITYTGGSAGTSGWYVGGIPGDGQNNIYKIDVSSPAQHYFLNRGTPTSNRSFLYDYTETFDVDGGATVTFLASGQDDRQWGNYDGASQPMTITGITGIVQPYDGQFAVLDVVSATLQ